MNTTEWPSWTCPYAFEKSRPPHPKMPCLLQWGACAYCGGGGRLIQQPVQTPPFPTNRMLNIPPVALAMFTRRPSPFSREGGYHLSQYIIFYEFRSTIREMKGQGARNAPLNGLRSARAAGTDGIRSPGTPDPTACGSWRTWPSPGRRSSEPDCSSAAQHSPRQHRGGRLA